MHEFEMFEKSYKQTEINNINQLLSIEDYLCLLEHIDEVRVFIDSYSFLQFGRDMRFLLSSKTVFSANSILMAVEQTMGSIDSCCRLGNFADANVLLRKYRDDLFFYLYITVATKSSSQPDEKAIQNIEKWTINSLDNLFIGDILKYIGKSPDLSCAIKKYNLVESLRELGDTLNSYVHSRGFDFYNKISRTLSRGRTRRTL